MDWLQVVVLAVVQGLTEFLPIFEFCPLDFGACADDLGRSGIGV
jgi:hypothetical protein